MSEPRTEAGRALLNRYRAVVRKRPDVDGLLWLHAILAIEDEASGATAAAALIDSEEGPLVPLGDFSTRPLLRPCSHCGSPQHIAEYARRSAANAYEAR